MANKRNSAVKRILSEARELAIDPSEDFCVAPLENDIFEWHATLRIPGSVEYEGGVYHVRILLPAEYPFKAPDMMVLTPNGRFEVNKKICIDGLTSFHAGSWQPAWGVRTAVIGLSSFWTSKGEALSAVGAIDYPPEERKRLAGLSRKWTCSECGKCNEDILAAHRPPAQSSSLVSTTPSATPPNPTSPTASEPLASSTLSSPPLLLSQQQPTSPSSSQAAAPAAVVASPQPEEAAPPTHQPNLALTSNPTSTPLTISTSPDAASSEMASTAPAASQQATVHTMPQVAPATSSPPVWFDGILAGLFLVLAILVARRLV